MSQKIGIIGTGWVAGVHIEALAKIPGAQVVAVAGRNEKRATELANSVDGSAYVDYREMLEKEKLDAVFILVPPHIHGEMEKACAEAVPAILVEKPIANNLEIALEVQKVFKEAGTIVSSAYMMRYHPSVNRARDLFAESTDKPALINGWWVNPMPPPLWWRSGAQSGGQLVEQCTHLVDAARYIVGDIVGVSAFSASGFVKDVPDYSTEDATTVTVQFAGGAVGSFTTGCFPRDFGAEIGLSIESRSLQCHFTGWGMELLADHGAGRTEHFNGGGNDIFVAQNTAFLKAAATGDTSGILSTYDSAVETLKVTLAAVESAKTGKVIRLAGYTS